MATPGVTQAEVDLDVDGGAILKAIDHIVSRIGTIQTQLRKVVETADSGAKGFDRKLTDTVKALQQSLGQLGTLEKTLSQGSRPITALNRNELLAGQTTRATNYAKTLKEATTSAEALQARLNGVNKKIAELGSQGQLARRADLSRQLNIQQALADLKKLDGELNRLDGRARRTKGDFSFERAGVTAAQRALETALKDGRRSNFAAEFQTLADAQARYGDTLSSQRSKAAESLRAYREQARALASDTSKEAEIEKAYRDRDIADRRRARDLTRQQAADEKAELAERTGARKALTAAEMLGAEQVAALNRNGLEADRAADADRLRRQAAIQRQTLAARKEAAQADAKSAGATQNRELVEGALARSTGLVAAARQRLATATTEEVRKLSEIIQIEKARTTELEKQLKAIDRLTRRQQADLNRPSADPARPTGLGRVLNADYIGAAIGRTAIYGLAAGAGYGALNAVSGEARAVVELEDKLKTLQAIAGATDSQLVSLGKTILLVGQNSRYSLSDIADAATTLAQAGFSVRDMQQSLGTITTLAAASGSSLTQTVDVVTSAIGSFQLQTAEAARVSDILLSALNRSKLTLTQVSEAIQYVGSTAYESNITLEQLVATAGAMANAGIRSGSTIGTGLRQFIIDLQTPTEKLSAQLQLLGITFADIDVKSRGLPAVIQTLSDRGFGAAQAYGALETRAAAAYLTIKNNLPTYYDLILAESQAGAAADANAKAMDSLAAQWQRFKNILQATVEDAVKPTVDGLQSLFTWLGDLLERIRQVREEQKNTTSGKIGSVGWYTLAGTGAGAATGSIVPGLGTAAGAVTGATGGFFYGLYANLNQTTPAVEDFATATAEASEQVAGQQQRVDGLNKEIDRLLLQHRSLAENQQLTQAETVTLTGRFEGLAAQLGGATSNVYGLIEALRKYRREQLGDLGTALTGEIGAIRNERGGLVAQGRRQIGGIRRMQGFATLTAVEQQAVAQPQIAVNARIISDAAKRVSQQFPELARSLNSLSATAGKWVQLGLQERLKSNQLGEVTARNSNEGQAISGQLERLRARFGELQPTAAGKSVAERSSIFGPLRGQLRAQMDAIKALSGGGEAAQAFRRQAISEFESLDNQINALAAPNDKESKAADRDAKRLARQQEASRKRFARNERFIDQTALRGSELDLQGDLKVAGQAVTPALLDQATTAVDEALAQWVADRTDLMEQEIKNRQLTGDQAAVYRREIAAQIIEKQESVARALSDAFGKVIDAQVKAIQSVYDSAIAGPEAALARAEGLRAGLNRPSLRGRVPDFVKSMADRRADEAREAFEDAQIPALQAQIASLEATLSNLRSEQRDLEAKAEAGGPNSAGIAVLAGDRRAQGDQLQVSLADMKTRLDGLVASSQAGSLLRPDGLSEAFASGAVNYQTANQTGLDFQHMLMNEINPALETGQNLLTNFFSTITTGTGTALSAFAGFASGIARYAQQLAAKLIATKLFDLFLSLAGSAAAPKINTIGAADLPTANLNASLPPVSFGRVHGGPIGFDSGGLVQNGLRDKDSVSAELARGEWVLQRSAVDSLGVDFVRQLNEHGADALHGLGKMPMLQMQPASQAMSVYLVAPESRPSLGPDDVLLVIQDDMLKGGATKKLVKHIAQGG